MRPACAPSCALIHRNPAGSLWLTSTGFVTDLPHNVGSVETRGIDGNLSYSYRFGRLGTLSAGFNGTWVDKYLVNDGLNPALQLRRLLWRDLRQPAAQVEAQAAARLPDAGRHRDFGPVALCRQGQA